MRMTKDTKPRLYFTCPIKAAYMAEYHGLDFEAIDYRTDICEPVETKELLDFDYYLVCQRYPSKNKIYLKKGSEFIIDATKGDLINYKSRSGKNQITANYLESFLDCEGILKWRLQSQGMNSPKIYKIDARKFSIIMRDNKQFFMPEVEND